MTTHYAHGKKEIIIIKLLRNIHKELRDIANCRFYLVSHPPRKKKLTRTPK